MSTQENPEVSLIMPARDTPLPAFQRMVASIRHQTYGLENFELIVVVHNSERSFEHMVHETFDADPTVRIIELHDDLQTASAPRNAGLAAARGEFIMFLDSDDELFPNYVSTALEGIRESEADIACFGYDHVADDESAAGMAQLFISCRRDQPRECCCEKAIHVFPCFSPCPIPLSGQIYFSGNSSLKTGFTSTKRLLLAKISFSSMVPRFA